MNLKFIRAHSTVLSVRYPQHLCPLLLRSHSGRQHRLQRPLAHEARRSLGLLSRTAPLQPKHHLVAHHLWEPQTASAEGEDTHRGLKVPSLLFNHFDQIPVHSIMVGPTPSQGNLA